MIITPTPFADAVVTAAARRARMSAEAAAPALWRIRDVRGIVIGHIQRGAGPMGDRFRAQRYHPAERSFRTLGEFWSCDQAVECLRFSR